MNQSFIKMLRFEWKANFTVWIFNLIIAFSILCMYFYNMNISSNPSAVNGNYFSIFIFMTWLFTMQSYQESTNNQSMQMYHLIGVSRKVKFFSKQFITLFAFPLLLITGIFFSMIIINLLNLGKQDVIFIPPREKLSNVLLFWLLGQSVSTLLAIVFKKNKLLYALLTFIVTQFALGFLVLIFNKMGLMGLFDFFPSTYWRILFKVFIVALSALFYGISYHLFFRRQL